MTKFTVLFLLCSGCAATQARPLASLPLDTHDMVASSTNRSVAVGPFTDARGPDFARTHHVPIVGLLHRSSKYYYPDVAGVFRGHDEDGAFVTTGSLSESMPEILVSAMQQMQLSSVVGTSAQAAGSDYFVNGVIKRSTLRRDKIPFVAFTIGVLGVPFEFTRLDLEYEVDLYDARAPGEPIFRRTYEVGGMRAKGLYYNHDAAVALLTSELRRTLPVVVHDVAQAIALAEARRQ